MTKWTRCTYCGQHGKSRIVWETVRDEDGAPQMVYLSVCKKHDSTLIPPALKPLPRPAPEPSMNLFE